MITNPQATVGASAIPVASADSNDFTSGNRPIPVLVQNLGAVAAFVGGPSVATALGARVDPLATLSVSLYPGEVVYAIAATGYIDFRVVQAGVIV